MRTLTAETVIKVRTPRERILTGDTRIKLSQILDFNFWKLTDDAHHYEIGEISKKTGLQKCLVNGRIVWLLPQQNSNFLQVKMSKPDLKTLAKSCKLARPDGAIKQTNNIKTTARNYLNYMEKTWIKKPVVSPFLNNAIVRINKFSKTHMFVSKGKPRAIKEIKQRTECLPYVRDILERTGKPASHYTKNGKESYSIVGRANINGTPREMEIIISRDKDDKYFYLSVFRLKK